MMPFTDIDSDQFHQMIHEFADLFAEACNSYVRDGKFDEATQQANDLSVKLIALIDQTPAGVSAIVCASFMNHLVQHVRKHKEMVNRIQ